MPVSSTQNVRDTPEKDRRLDYSGSGEYPFHGGMNLEGGVNVEDPKSVEVFLARYNAALADVEAGLAGAGLRPGMAGYDDAQAGGVGYGVPSPGIDPAPAGLFVK